MALIFHFINGMSSFPLTFIFFQRGRYTTKQFDMKKKGFQLLGRFAGIGCGFDIGRFG